ncbi:SAM-dependent methyltransferase [Streptomyces sp. NPDC055078]
MTTQESNPHTLAAVAAFYDNIEAMRALMGESIHVGYWPEGHEDLPLAQAQDHLTDLVAAASGLCQGDQLLDVGCGTGAPSRRMVRDIGACVTGVSISARQVETATAASRREGLGSRADYHLADAASLPFPDESFDAAIAIESIFHMTDKPKALKEILRVLRPGARLAIADVADREMPDLPAESDAGTFLSTLVALLNREQYRQLADAAGFHVEDITDITAPTEPTYTRLLQHIDTNRTELAALSTPEQVAALEGVTRFCEAASHAGGMEYLLITLGKPAA